jgi:hypothetical protein
MTKLLMDRNLIIKEFEETEQWILILEEHILSIKNEKWKK